MNNQRPPLGETLLRSLLLSLAAMWLLNHFFGWPGQPKPQNATRDPKIAAQATLAEAFKGIDPHTGTLVSPAAAQKEVDGLKGQIAANESDSYSYWARLRSGLLQQYILNDMPSATKNYDDIINHSATDDIDAQAIFQKGDWQWRVAEAKEDGIAPAIAPAATNAASGNTASANAVTGNAASGNTASGSTAAGNTATPDDAATRRIMNPTKQDATTTLEHLVHRGRAAAGFLDIKIYVPSLASSTSAAGLQGADVYKSAVSELPFNAPPPHGFQLVPVGSLSGTLQSPHPFGILDRINLYYSTTFLNKMMDAIVNLFGANPNYSYGLAIMFLATLMRIIMQPINRKQYESMKGMQAIAPEMKKIQDKYKAKPTDSPEVQRDKQMKMFKEVQALQKAHGVSPQLGCALAFVQIPIFIYFVNPLMMHYEPKMELVGAHFLWVHSLAHPDYILLALYGLSMLVSFRLSATPPTDDMQRQMQVMTTFVMPIMMPFFMKGFSSAFIFYWMTFNIISMLFQYRMMKAADPNKSFVKTIIGDGLPSLSSLMPAAPPTPPEDTVPPRPKKNPTTNKTSVVKSLEGLTHADGTVNGNGTANGNGAAKNNGKPLNGLNGNGAAPTTPEDNSESEAELPLDGTEDSMSGTATVAQNQRSNNTQRARRRRRH